MPVYEATVDQNGAVQLPKELVDRLQINPGQRVEFFETLDGEVFFHAVSETTDGWKGLFDTAPKHPPLSVREMDEAIADHLHADNERILKQGRVSPDPSKRSAAE